MFKSVVVFDLDGTLASIEERLHHIKEKNWEQFHLAGAKAAVRSDIARMAQVFFFSNLRIVICTGRDERYREMTHKWLVDNRIGFHELLMRPEGNYHRDITLKPKLLEQYRPRDVLAIYEDRRDMVRKWRELGYTCLQIAEDIIP